MFAVSPQFTSCADLESFVRVGPSLTFFFVVFLVDEGRKDQNTTISRTSLAHQGNAI